MQGSGGGTEPDPLEEHRVCQALGPVLWLEEGGKFNPAHSSRGHTAGPCGHSE